MVFLCIPDAQTSSIWSMYKELKDPGLAELATALSATVLKSRADSTVKKYLYAFQRWRSWAMQKDEISVFPIRDHQFVLYLQHIALVSGSRSAVEEALNAASWVCQIAGHESLSESPIIKTVLSGLKRQKVNDFCHLYH